MTSTTKWEKEFRQMASDIMFQQLSNKHPITGKQMTMKEGKKYFDKRVNDVLAFIQDLLTKQSKEMVEMIEGMKKDYKGFNPRIKLINVKRKAHNQALTFIINKLKGEHEAQ